jgi:hypothetical protein
MSASSSGPGHRTDLRHRTAPRTASGANAIQRGNHLLTGNTSTPAWPGRTGLGRFGRAITASFIALLGLAFFAIGPTAVAFGWHGYLKMRTAERVAAEPVVGAEVHDGPVSFVVHELECEIEVAWSVHGRLCEVRITARNRGDEPVTIPGSAQMLHGPEGLRHLPISDPAPFGTLGPGDEETAVIEFDVPPHALITHVGVHADPYSDGARIRLPGQ